MKISIHKMNVLVQRQEQQAAAMQTVSVFQKELERAAGSMSAPRPGKPKPA
ncbi:MAG TPA: hypothetical protein VGK36_05075 [Candidatus Angelobacter sp.]|jgi:hypothetical protein